MFLPLKNSLRTIFPAAGMLAALASAGQQPPPNKPDIPKLLLQLHADEWTEREAAYERLKSDPEALRNPKVQEALLELLDRENHVAESVNRLGKGTSEVYGEEYSEYSAELGYVVNSLADWSDPRQVCILVHAFYDADDPDSGAAAKIASHAGVAVPCLMQMYAGDVTFSRATAVEVLVQALAKGRDQLDASTADRVRHLILSALQDPDELVRSRAMRALGWFGGEDMVPALEQVAKSDPAVDKRGRLWIREYASKAITEIRERKHK